MSQANGQLARVADLIRTVKFPVDAWYALEVYRSYPVPVRSGRGVALAFLFGNETKVPAQGRWYSPPARLALVDPATAQVTEVRHVGPSDFGRPTPDNAFADRLPPLTVESAAERPRLQQSMFDAYDLLLPAFAASRTQLSGAERDAAAAYRRAFATLAEPPLRPYYDSVGRDFNQWLATAK